MNKNEQFVGNENASTHTSVNRYCQQKKMKLESEMNSNTVLKPIHNVKERILYIYPSISVETISDVLDKAEQDINQGIQLLQKMNNKEQQKSNSSEDQIDLSAMKNKRRKRNYVEHIEQHQRSESNQLISTHGILLPLSQPLMPEQEYNKPVQSQLTILNPKEEEEDHRIESKDTEAEREAQKMVDELEGITSKEDLRKYLLSKFPSLLALDNQATAMESNDQVDNLQTQLKHIINFNQQLTQDIALSYNQYDVLKKDNDKNIPLLCNAISQLESNILFLENNLEEKKLETTKYSELFKKENQSELVLSVEYGREGY